MINRTNKVAILNISGHEIPVYVDPQLFTDSGNIGEWQYREVAVIIDGNCAPAVQQETFCHEVIEVWNEIYELKLKHRQIQVLGSVFFQFLANNDPYLFTKRKELFLDILKDINQKDQ
jgi:hypothetical protein